MKFDEILNADYLDKEDKLNTILSYAFGIQCIGYNSKITDDILTVLKESDGSINESVWYQDIAKKHSLPEDYVELVKYIICNNDYAEYGTSPRGAWLTDKGKELLKQIEILEKLK